MGVTKLKKAGILLLVAMLEVFGLTAQQSAQARGLDVIGFGYDVFGNYADMGSVMQYQLFDLGPTRDQPIGAYTFQVPNQVHLQNISKHNVTTVEGEDLRSYSQHMSVELGLSADTMFFSGSINSSFGTSTEGSSSNHFFTYRDANTKWRVSLDTRSIENLKKHLKPEARRDINTMDPARLFSSYGAYYIASAYLGGRAELNVTVKQTEQTSMQDIGVAVEAKYKAISGSANTNISTNNSASSMLSNSKLTVVGGNSEYANNIRDPEQYRMWASGINDWPILCDFEKGSLRPIWELADSPARSAELKQAFDTIKQQHPLPDAFVDILGMQKKVYMVQNRGTQLYWDMPGYNDLAKAGQGDDIVLYDADAAAALPEGIDRIIKVVPNKFEPEWVALQPQNTNFVAAVNDAEGNIKLGPADFRDQHIQFKMEAVDFQNDVYTLISRQNGLALTAEKEGKNSRIVLRKFEPKNLNQQWYFKTLQPEAVAQPDPAQYVIACAAGGKYWDLPGNYPAIRGNAVQLWDGSDNMPADRVVSIEPFDNGNFRLLRLMSQPSALLTARENSQLAIQNRTNNADQQWRFIYAGEPNTYYIKSRGLPGQAIDGDANHISENGCHVNVCRSYESWEGQKWTLLRWRNVPDTELLYKGNYQIRTSQRNLSIEVAGDWQNNNRNNMNVGVWHVQNTPDATVKFLPQIDGSYAIQFQNGGRVLDLIGGQSGNGTNVEIWEYKHDPWQYWFFENMGSGNYKIRNVHTQKPIDINTGNDYKAGDNVHEWDPNNNFSQLWQIFHADGPLAGKRAF